MRLMQEMAGHADPGTQRATRSQQRISRREGVQIADSSHLWDDHRRDGGRGRPTADRIGLGFQRTYRPITGVKTSATGSTGTADTGLGIVAEAQLPRFQVVPCYSLSIAR